MRIGILAELAGTTVPTVRYYEQIGLLRPAARQGGGQRTYDREDVRRLAFVRRCREFQVLDRRGAYAGVVDQAIAMQACIDARAISPRRHLEAVRSKLAELKALESSIASLVSTCNSTCAGGVATDCSIFVDLNGDTQDGRPAKWRSMSARPVAAQPSAVYRRFVDGPTLGLPQPEERR